jgi:hypothetical protein
MFVEGALSVFDVRDGERGGYVPGNVGWRLTEEIWRKLRCSGR